MMDHSILRTYAIAMFRQFYDSIPILEVHDTVLFARRDFGDWLLHCGHWTVAVILESCNKGGLGWGKGI